MNRTFAYCLILILSQQLYAGGGGDPRVHLPDEYSVYAPKLLAKRNTFAKLPVQMSEFFAENPGWRVQYDEATQTPHRAWGEGIQIEGYTSVDATSAADAGTAFLRAHAALLNADPSGVRLLSAEMANGKTYVKFGQTVNGIDVLFSSIDFRISQKGKVFLFGSDYHPTINVSTTPSIGRDAAREFAKAGLDYSPSNENVEDGSLYILPLRLPSSMEYHLVYNFRITSGPMEIWDTYVDAHSGTVLWRRNLSESLYPTTDPQTPAPSATVTGRLVANVPLVSWLYGSSDVPVPNAYVNVDGKEYKTDADGRFTATISGSTATLITRMAGPYAASRRADSGSVKNAIKNITVTGGQNIELRWDSTNSSPAERSAFYHIGKVHDWIRTIDASNTLVGLDQQILGLVNQTSVQCNADWNGSRINFYVEAGGCSNSAFMPDVIYHEYGHAINTKMYTRLLGHDLTNGTIGEATADINSNMLRDDPRIGIGFLLNSPNDGIIRNSNNTLKYPNDLVNEIHDDGKILTGAVWDTRKAIGLDITARLAHYAKYGTPDGSNLGGAFCDYFLEFLVADDDDGNLANGTPHSSSIIPAFHAHGIPGGYVTFSHNPIEDQPASVLSYPILCTADLDATIDTKLFSIAGVSLVYSTDNFVTHQAIPLVYSASCGEFTGSFPGQKAGSFVRYYFQITDNLGGTSVYPADAPSSVFSFFVGFIQQYTAAGESEDGWTVSSTATGGAWILAQPIGTWNTHLGAPPASPWVQPNCDHTTWPTGSGKCWITGNGTQGGKLTAASVMGGSTKLTTQVFDISQYNDPFVRYWRWYTNDAGTTPTTQAWVVSIISDGTQKYLESTKQSNAGWQEAAFRIKDFFPIATKVKFQFVATNSDSRAVIEAAVDDFNILDTPNALTDVSTGEPLPTLMELAQNYPNPFAAATNIRYRLISDADVTLTIYSSLGEILATLVSGQQSAGAHGASFDASKLLPGTYRYELRAGLSRIVRTMTVLR